MSGKTWNAASCSVMYERHCVGELAVSCHNLGVMLEHGEGVPPDPAWAAGAYRRACQLGWAQGCTHFGVLQVQGQGVTRDLGAAGTWFQRACDMGDARGCELVRALKSVE